MKAQYDTLVRIVDKEKDVIKLTLDQWREFDKQVAEEVKKFSWKLFVWDENVLCDYTCGMVVVIARSREEAMKFLFENDEYWGIDALGSWHKSELEYNAPKIIDLKHAPITSPLAWWSYGGG